MSDLSYRRCGYQFARRLCLIAGLSIFSNHTLAQQFKTEAEAIGKPSNGDENARVLGQEECRDHSKRLHGSPLGPDQTLAMQQEINAYQGLVEEALAMRANAIQLIRKLREKLDRSEPLSGRDLQLLNQGAIDLLAQRAALMQMSTAHECWLDEPIPSDANAAQIQRSGIAISLSAALVLYDNYLSAISLYRNDPKLRKHLNSADRGFALNEGELNRIAASYVSAANRHRVRRGLEWFEKNGAALRNDDMTGYRYLVELIEQSPSRQMVRHARPLAFLNNMFDFFSTMTFDKLDALKNESVNLTSLLFGNTVGLVESRRGKLDARSDVLEQVAGSLQAGDILLEKTPFRLTDAFIPGHWGHVAIWVGTETELRQLGIWEHPVVRPYQANILRGNGVVEALRSGVEMNQLTQFLNVDDLGVLRQNNLPDADRAEVILHALRQVGKAYDFNFDVESTDRIVCSELVYHAYGHLEWPTARTLGRSTISPDNVAVRAIAGGPLQVVLLYHDGQPAAESPDQAMAGLLGKRVTGLASK